MAGVTDARFVHLNVHTEFSLLEASCRIRKLVARAKKLGMDALAITDHGNLFGAVQFYKACVAAEIKPILGCEIYVAVGGDRFARPKGMRRPYRNLVLLAETQQGWLNLIELVSKGYLEGFYYKPRVDLGLLKEYREGIIAIASAQGGHISGDLRDGLIDAAEQSAQELLDIYGPDHFFLEIHNHKFPAEKVVTDGLVEIGKKLHIPLVATNGVRYLMQDDAAAHDCLMAIGHQTTIDSPRRFRYETEEYYLKSPKKMCALFADHPSAIANTLTIADRCNVEMTFDEFRLPRFEPPAGLNDSAYLAELCETGLEWRYGTSDVASDVRERLEHELSIINKMGYASYFLIVWDFMNEARKRNVPLGPGRGSAAGSLVSYVLGITGIDPLQFGLLFERFLNPDRISMPDIDIDFCYERRGDIIEYVTKKYGADSVSQIITFGQMKSKAVIRDVGRAMGMNFGDVDGLAKLVPNELNITLQEALEKEPELSRRQKEEPEVGRLLEYALKLEGLARHCSTHAAGVVICGEPLTNYVPLFKHSSSGDVTSQYPMNDLESLGLLKMDFLGLRTLTVMRYAVDGIRERLGEEIDIDAIPLDDAATLDMLDRAECIGVFQMESAGMRDLAKNIKIEAFEDIVALVALFRPGPMNMLPDYIARKKDPSLVRFDDERLAPILRETRGIMLYQEQVMQIAVTLAGFTLAESDTLRKAMGKKKPEIMAKMEQQFVEGAVANDCPEQTAKKIWNDIVAFAGYGFNKSHSAAYGYIAYQTAWLKANYPTDFMAALLTSEIGNTDKVVQYIAESERMGITVSSPHINESTGRFTAVEESKIRFGLAAVKNVGQGPIENIVEERSANGEYKSLYDFCRRVDLRLVNRRVIESLIRAGAMDMLPEDISHMRMRSELFATVERAMEVGQINQRDRVAGQTSLLDMLSGDEASLQQTAEETYVDVSAWPEQVLLQGEKEVLGFYVTGHPLARYAPILANYCSATAHDWQQHRGKAVYVGGSITSVKHHVTKNGAKMAFIEVEDRIGTMELTVFSDTFSESADLLQTDELVVIFAHVDERNGEPSLLAQRVYAIDDVEDKLTTEVHVRLGSADLSPEGIDELHRIAREHPGECGFVLHVRVQDVTATIDTPQAVRVSPTQELVEAITAVVPDARVEFHGSTQPRTIRPDPRRRFSKQKR